MVTFPTIPQICGDLDAAAWRVTYARLHRERKRRRVFTLFAVIIGVLLLAHVAAVGGWL